MTDLQNFIAMLNGADGESFTKEKSNNDWKVVTRGITIYFNEDGSYRFMSSH